MTIQLYCLLAGLVLPYIWAFGTVPFRTKQFGNFDLNEPRVQADLLKDGGARVWGAQSNAWEALAVFAVANLAATMAGVDPAGNWSTAAMIWVAVRVLHGAFYIMDIPPLRVLAFATGFGMSGWIVFMAIQQ
jgi:uncharacterized MAPEG superfamily protein